MSRSDDDLVVPFPSVIAWVLALRCWLVIVVVLELVGWVDLTDWE